MTHYTGRRGGKNEELILQMLAVAVERPAGILASDVEQANELAKMVRERAPDFVVEVRGTVVNVRRRA